MKKAAALLMICALLMTCVPCALADFSLASETGAIRVTDYWATSQLRDQYGAYTVANCFDGNLNTTWAEGESGQGIDAGITGVWQVNRGRWLLSGIVIWGGYQKSRDVYYKNSRPCDVQVRAYCDGASQSVMGMLADMREGQVLVFDQAMVLYDRAEVTVSIDSVYPGNKYTDTCITDIDLLVEPY